MPNFSYKARSMKGVLVEGVLEATDPNDVKQKLSLQNLIPIQVSKAAGKSFDLSTIFKPTIKTEELVLFTKQFFTLFKAGMGMEALLSTLGKQSGSKFMADSLEQIRIDIQEGSSLVMAFGKHPRIFDELYVSMLASGEEAGILEEVLSQLATLLEKDSSMKKGIKSAMLYPKIVIGVLVCASAVLMIFVIPKFAEFFANFHAELPLPTRMMMGTSDFVVAYWWMILGVSGFLWFTYRRYYATPKGRYQVDRLSYKMFVFGPLALKVANARFSTILSSLYKSGLPVTKALDITGKTIGNEAFMRDVRFLQAEVERGKGISDSMRNLKYFSPIIIEATAIGEKTGSLDSMLKSIGDHYDMEITHTVKNLTTLLEPLLLVIIFGMVAMFALAIFLPIWGMSKAALGH